MSKNGEKHQIEEVLQTKTDIWLTDEDKLMDDVSWMMSTTHAAYMTDDFLEQEMNEEFKTAKKNKAVTHKDDSGRKSQKEEVFQTKTDIWLMDEDRLLLLQGYVATKQEMNEEFETAIKPKAVTHMDDSGKKSQNKEVFQTKNDIWPMDEDGLVDDETTTQWT